jgi:hypothetical protein
MAGGETLQALADRQAITDLIYRYCRAMDRIDAELGYSLWHEGASVDYDGYYKGDARGFIDKACETHRRVIGHSHQISNIIIELDGDRAGSETYVTANLRLMRQGTLKQLTVWGRYVDEWSRREGRWGIDRRVQIHDFDEMRDVTAASEQTRTRRDRSDPSYEVLRGAR